MNSLTFLGTAGDIELLARQQRATGGLLLELEGNQLHLDPGPGALNTAVAAGRSPRNTIAVIATSNSLLRANDVNACVGAMTLDGMDTHGILLGARSVIEGEEAVATRRSKLAVEGLVSLAPGQRIGLNEVTLRPVEALGQDPSGVGLRLEAGDLVIGYTGETAWYDGLPAAFEGCAVLIINVRHPAGTTEQGALNLEEAERLVAAVKPRHAYLTGFGSKLAASDLRDAARQLQRRTKTEVTAAKDGLSVEL